MAIILFVWFCAFCVFVLPPPVAAVVLLGAAALRLLYITHESAIEAAAEVARFPAVLAADWKRNGLAVLRTIAWWTVAICAWLAIVMFFKIPF